ncbi:glycosyltransferase family 4 protein [Patescibacteria group bacterium]|nr:glycosyltransferase family 4 protein [Patescibacteria group bacterium]MBU4512529.1 glycosyltransferase family 4 protein [Patescibacteria group bacterium]MCG2693492.1 glycosyltransferase family 4 protein [Candidatus Parcubacteria bacterium]
MKLTYIATSVIPAQKANSYQVMKMCEAFTHERVDVELLIPVRFGGVRNKGDAFEYYGVEKSFRIRKIFSIDLIPLEKIIGHFGFWIQNASFTIFLSIYLLFRRVDVVYTRDKFALFFLALCGRKNLIWEAHSFPKKFSWAYEFILKRLKRTIVITEGLKKEFIKVGYPEQKILVASDAVDLEEFNIKESQEDCRKKLDLPTDKKLILYTGHLFQWKGVYTLADASKYLSKDCQVIVVGGMDKDLKNYQDYLEKNGLSKVRTRGFRPHKEMAYFSKAADVLVLPNSAKEKISTTYTSPMKLFEYMASERPIVVSDLPSMREVLSKEEAVFVEPDNPRSLANGINRVFLDNELSEKISKNSKLLVKKYTWEKRASDILNFIK